MRGDGTVDAWARVLPLPARWRTVRGVADGIDYSNMMRISGDHDRPGLPAGSGDVGASTTNPGPVREAGRDAWRAWLEGLRWTLISK